MESGIYSVLLSLKQHKFRTPSSGRLGISSNHGRITNATYCRVTEVLFTHLTHG